MDLHLHGDVPVLYFAQDDADRDGMGYNVHLASSDVVYRYATLDEALVEYRDLLDNVGVRANLAARYIVTNAPDAYDYGHTTFLAPVTTDRFQSLRCVRVVSDQPDYSTTYQADRYRSGLYVAFVGTTYDEAVQAAKSF